MASVVRIRIFPHGAELHGTGPARLIDLVDEGERALLPLSCRGANCGVCRLRVLSGGDLIEPASPRERETLTLARARDDERLGCQLELRVGASGDLELALSSTDAPQAAGS